MHISTALSAVLCASQAAAAMVPNWKDFPLEDISKWQKPLPSKPPPRPVNVTLYAMSRCPDAVSRVEPV
jgi:hypothetical protein